ncbi:hypothetical protein [Williamsia serinedens]
MAKRYADRVKLVTDYKTSRGCTDCGWNKHPKALELDHLPGCVKVAPLSRMVADTRYSIEQIKAEIAKCEVVCANCHRIRTFTRQQLGADWDLDRSDDPDDGEPPFEQLTLEV